MRKFYVCLVYNCIVKRGINLTVAQKLLNLFDRHTFFNRHGGESAAEFVRMHMPYVRCFAKFGKKPFYSCYGQPVPGRLHSHKKRGIVVFTWFQVLLKMDFCFRIKINHSFFIAFSKNDTFSFGKVYVCTIQFDQFSYTYACRYKQIYNSKISRMCTLISQFFQIFISKSFLNKLGGFYFVNAPDRAF